MAEYIEREALIEDLDAAAKHGGMGAIISQTLQRYVKRAPAADVVSRAAYNQTEWERDLAIQQLRSDYGVALGERKANVTRVVRCNNCKNFIQSTGLVVEDGVGMCNGKMVGLVRRTDYCSFGELLCNGKEKD